MQYRKKSQYFEIDAIVAITLLIVGFIYIRSLTLEHATIQQNEGYSSECVELLRNLKVSDLDPQTRQMLFSSNLARYTEMNNSLAKQIAIYYSEKNRSLAVNLTRLVLDQFIPQKFGYSVVIRSSNNESVIYNRTLDQNFDNLAVTRTMITGLHQDKAIKGNLATLFLDDVNNILKEYMFFGGYAGQGSIWFIMDIEPAARIQNAYFEGYVGGSSINVSVNGGYCGTIARTAGNTINSITSSYLNCSSRFHSGKNMVFFEANRSMYIGGGLFEIMYSVNNPQSKKSVVKKYIPGIDGRINLYDSVFFDGNVSSIKVNISFNKSGSSNLLFNFGNETLFQAVQPGSYNFILNGSNLSSPLSAYSDKNIPIRFGSPEIETFTDIVWITDRSNSMDECGDFDNDYSLDFWGCGTYTDFGQGLGEWKFHKPMSLNASNGACVDWNSQYTGTHGLVAHWKFEGNLNDEISSNHGTCTSCPDYTAGMMGQAADFDGAADDVRVAKAGSSLDITGDEVTVSAWVKPNITMRSWIAGVKERSGFPWDSQYDLQLLPTGALFVVETSAGNWYSSSIPPPANKWHHLAGVYDGSNMYIYADGVQDPNPVPQTGNINQVPEDFYIGGWNDMFNFDGLIDEVKVFNKALSQSDILALANPSPPTQSYISKKLLNEMANFTFEFEFEFMKKTKNTMNSLQVEFRDKAGGNSRKINVSDVRENVTLDFSGTVDESDIPNFKNKSKLTVKQYGSNMEIYIDDNLLIARSANFGNLSGIYIRNYNTSHICYSYVRVYDEKRTGLAAFQYGNYKNDSEPGFYYESIAATKVPISSSPVPGCNPNDLCYCYPQAITQDIRCKDSHPAYQDCCRSSCCNTTWDDCQHYNFDSLTDEYISDPNANVTCNLTYYNSRNMSLCYTQCAASGSWMLGNRCSQAMRVNCSDWQDSGGGYCSSAAHFTSQSQAGNLCDLATLSRSDPAYGSDDADMSDANYLAHCTDTLPQLSTISTGTTLLTDCSGSCKDSAYSMCQSIHTLIGQEDSCTPLLGDYCLMASAGEDRAHHYNRTLKGYRTWTRVCTRSRIRVGWDWYRLTNYSSAFDCHNYDSFEYECRNQFQHLMKNNSIYLGNYPLYIINYGAAGFYNRNFTVDKSNIGEIYINLKHSDNSVLCYLNNNTVVYLPYYINVPESQGRIYNISLNYLNNGENILGCEFKQSSGSLGAFELKLVAVDKSGTSTIIIDYLNEPWRYQNQRMFCSSSISPFDANCEYGRYVSSCSKIYPWTPANRLSISTAVYGNPYPDIDDYSNYFNPIIQYLNNMLGGFINQMEAQGTIPDSFWDSSDVLVIDYNGNTGWQGYYDNILNASQSGKIVILNDFFYDYIRAQITGEVPENYVSYGLLSHKFRYGAGSIIGIEGSGSSLLTYFDNFNYDMYDRQAVAAHIYTAIYPVWNQSNSPALTCPHIEYCIPGKERHCELCTYERMGLANYLSSKYIDYLLNFSGTRIGAISYGTDLSCGSQIDYFTDNYSALDSAMRSYYPDCGQTCIGCSLRKAMDMFNSTSVYAPLKRIPISLEKNLVSWWRMDDANTTGQGALVEDYMNRNNGTAYGNASQTDAGRLGKGFKFDGSGDYIDVGMAGFDPGNFTVSLWLNMKNVNAGNERIFNNYANVATKWWMLQKTSAGNLAWRVDDDISGFEEAAHPLSNFRASEWYHVVGVRNGTDILLYVNGSLVASDTGLGASVIIDSPNNVQIGKDADAAGSYFNGMIDEVMVFNRSLSSGEISALYSLGQKKHRFIVIMSDGEANYYWDESSQTSKYDKSKARQQAINYSNQSCTQYNANLFTVAFGSLEGEQTLRDMAKANSDAGCTGLYFGAKKKDDLKNIFDQIANLIAYNLQTVDGYEPAQDRISPESYIEYKANKSDFAPPGTIKFMSETGRFSSPKDIDLSGLQAVSEAKLVSYSGNMWTSHAYFGDRGNAKIIFNLSKFGDNYRYLGDPYIVGVPSKIVSKITSRQYTADIRIANSSLINSAGSSMNKMLYTGHLPRFYTSYSDILKKADGCTWNITFSDKSYAIIKVPAGYSGTKTCTYTHSGGHRIINYDSEDAIDAAVASLLKKLDFTGNKGEVDIKFSNNTLSVQTKSTTEIPFLWGPSLLECRVWR
ncbi:hypothetical protein GF323_00245 [Candidatus Woesearchaeota archaeon]|nr:hypothetical protein [Candidatus Woesearchaeota archaeon]